MIIALQVEIEEQVFTYKLKEIMKTIKIKPVNEHFLQQVKDNGGVLKHDYSNPVHFQHVVDSLGGEEFLKEKYPLVYEMVCNTREYHTRLKSEGRAVSSTTPGYKNSAKIRYVNFDRATKLATASSIHRTGINPSLAVISRVVDLSNNQNLDGFAIVDNNVATIEGYVEQPARTLISSQDRKFHVMSDFNTMTYDDMGTRINESESHVSDVIKVKGVSTIVKSVSVTHPEATKNPLRKNTVIVYDRQGIVNQDYDYYFPLVSAGNNIKMQLRFEGSATFDSDVRVIAPTAENVRLELEHPSFGTVVFNNYAGIVFKAEGNKLSWVFPEDWKAQLFKKTFVSGIDFDIYCEMKVQVAFGNDAPLPTLVPITISSKNVDHVDPSYKRIRKINIYWGCMGKDTQIKMADGSLKAVSAIQPGESIMSAYGEVVKVTDVMTGKEAQMIKVKVRTGDSILLTDEHPILTERGMMMAKHLCVGDVLILEGEKAFLSEAYKIEYNDTVYSLVLEKPEAYIIGNGFIIGDFESQQKAIAETTRIETVKMKLDEYQEEMVKFYAELDEQLRNANY